LLAWCTQAPPQSNRNKTAETKGGAAATTQADAKEALQSFYASGNPNRP
jgi:hypothetical protein